MTIQLKKMVALALLACPAAVGAQALADDCSDLTALRIPDVRIVEASRVEPNGEWKAPLASPPRGFQATVSDPFCRVKGVIEDEIGFEVWLPDADNWDGRMLGNGNGGFAGFIRYEGLARGINRGMAATSTDTGHKQSEKQWPIGHPRRLENYGHRAQHLLAVNSKKIIAAYYGEAPHHSYFMGCSGGGMQGMNEVQRYPADYDGIIAGAHGQSIVGISARWLTSALIAQSNPEAHVDQSMWRQVAEATIAACDEDDGLKDGILDRPELCEFDPASAPGLSPAQQETVRRLQGPVLAEDGRELYPGFSAGVAYEPIEEPGRPGELFAQWLYDDPDWDVTQFKAGRDVPLAEAVVPGAAPQNPNLGPFAQLGGKFISFHGWNDEIVPLDSTLNYFKNVGRYMGEAERDSFYKIYLIPGLDHCRGGAGADIFGGIFGPELPGRTPDNDMLKAMIRWVEDGVEPGRIEATKLERGEVTMTRPICPWPQVVQYKGTGDPDVAESFECAAP